MNSDASLSKLIQRIEKLEKAVFGKGSAKVESRTDFGGATGGLRLLLSKGFFDRKRHFHEIETELQNRGYHYSKQAVQTPLNRLSRADGPLVGFKQKGKKVYAKRK